MKKDRLTIGKIFNVHGIRGEVKVMPLTDDVSRFSTLKNCFIGDREFKVKKTRLNKKHVIIKLEGVDDRDSAERFKNSYMEVDRKDSVPLEEGEYYLSDLIGFSRNVHVRPEARLPKQAGDRADLALPRQEREHGAAADRKRAPDAIRRSIAVEPLSSCRPP